MIRSQNKEYFEQFIQKMAAEGISPVVIDTFIHYLKQVMTGETGLISEAEIQPVEASDIVDHSDLASFADAGKNILKQTVMIILNGGLGTSMGLTSAKSLIPVKNGKTFLEISADQAARRGIKLCLMNSFNTHSDTVAAFERFSTGNPPIFFQQHKFPKVLKEGLTPVSWPKNPKLEWNPPGHGDVYTALYTSGTLVHLLENGIRYAFISNSDNLGATPDASLLGYFAENQLPFMLEVADRTQMDRKGGHLARIKNGRLVLREIAQCHPNELDSFQNIRLHRFFNTNNIWINLGELKKRIDRDGRISLPVIINPKTVDPRDESSPPVYQIETAMGAAISLFEGAAAVRVPRSRFRPVKTCNELIVIQSDCYRFSQDGELIMDRDPLLPALKVDLDAKYYGKLDAFNQRFPEGPPSLLTCESLAVAGDIRFERNVVVRGNVRLINSRSDQAVVKEGAIIDHDMTFS